MTTFLEGFEVRRLGAVALVLGLLASLVGIIMPASGTEGDTPVPVLEDGTNGCNGVRDTPGSENTSKRLDPTYPSDFNPGGMVGFIIDYPRAPEDGDGRTTFVITDCVFVDGTAVAKYTVSFVRNTAAFSLRFAVPIAADTALGAQFCNYAKTTATPSEGQASNRKAEPACFTVGGALRIEKRSGSATGPLLEGASFDVTCSPAVSVPPTIITGLSTTSHSNPDGTVSASGVSAGGSIAINGPSGTPCTVTETAAPVGYQIDPTPRILVIPVGTSRTVNVFVNRQVGALVITKATTGGSGTFTFNVNCDGTDFDRSVTIESNGSRTITGIPTGTSCTVTEEGHDEFTSVSVPANGQVIIASGNNTVAFTNTRKTGDLVITKATTGGSGTFTFNVNCDGTDFDRSVTIESNGSRTITGIPTGTSCTVTEEGHDEFTSVSVPANGQVIIASGNNTVAFTNTRKTGDLVITKATTGGSGTFTFNVNCDGTDFDRSVTIESNGSRTITGIPTGTSCTVTEEDDSQFTGFSVPADGTVVIVVGENHVAFTNTRDTGNLVVNKATNGGTGSFNFEVDCEGAAFDDSFTIDSNGSHTVSGIPTGTECTVSEEASALFTSISVPANGTVTIAPGFTAIAFTNTAKPTGITLDKKVNGTDHATDGDALVVHAGDQLTYTVRIQNTGEVPLTLAALADSLEPGFLASCPQGLGSILAAGASFTCTYQRTATSSATNVASVVGLDGLGRRSNASDSTIVRVISPAITITKTASPVSASPGDVVTFTYTVTNTGDTALTDIVVVDDVLGSIGVIPTLPAGGSATLTKTQTVQASTPNRNIGTATGSDVLGKKVTDSAAADIVIVLVLGVVQERQPAPLGAAPAATFRAAPAQPDLPRTGGPISVLALGGFAIVLLGGVLLLGGSQWRRA